MQNINLEHILLYSSGPQSCLKKSKGCKMLKFSLPAGYWRVGNTFGSDLPYPFLRELYAFSKGTS